MGRSPLIQAVGLRKVYGSGHTQVPALRNIDLMVGPGECVGVMGPSGCGKSTLIKIIGLIAMPTSGSIVIDGQDAPRSERDRARLRNRFFGHIQQDLAVIDEETVEGNVTIPLDYALERMSRAERRRRARFLLERVGIDWAISKRTSDLSGGERQRVAIARAMANEPRVILADEPTSALDGRNVEAVMQLLLSVQRYGGALLVATHDPRVAARCDRVLQMQDGLLTEA